MSSGTGGAFSDARRSAQAQKPSLGPLHLFSILLVLQIVPSARSARLSSGPSRLYSAPARLSSSPARFSSHVTVHTPARSFSHGVGDPLPSPGRRIGQPRPSKFGRRQPYQREGGGGGGGGYPRVTPAVPFLAEDRPRPRPYNPSPWQLNSFQETPIAVLPPSPYKVDSPDPESLWPEGLFLPPAAPYAFARRRADAAQRLDSSDPLDPYLLEGSEAVAAVSRANTHGLYYFHDIPHIQSILANQELRVENNLKPHRLGSIRHTWPYNRP